MKRQGLDVRRSELIQRIAQQRHDINSLAQTFEQRIKWLDKSFSVIQKIKQQPKLSMIGVVLFLVVLRRPVYRMRLMMLSAAKLLLHQQK